MIRRPRRSTLFPYTPLFRSVLRMTFEDSKSSTITDVADIGPFAYTLNPAVAAPLDQIGSGHVSTPVTSLLHMSTSASNSTVTLSAYCGDTYFNGSPNGLLGR